LCKILPYEIILRGVRNAWYYLQNHWFSYVFWCFTTVFTTHFALNFGILAVYPTNNPSNNKDAW